MSLCSSVLVLNLAEGIRDEIDGKSGVLPKKQHSASVSEEEQKYICLLND